MKQVKIMNLPECDKLLYCGGAIAQQIGTMFVVDDEDPRQALSYPILSGGRSQADGWLTGDTECYETPVVCRKGQKIGPRVFAKFVKRAMHEEVPSTAWELYQSLREYDSDLQDITIVIRNHKSSFMITRKSLAAYPPTHRISISRCITTVMTARISSCS